MKKLMLLFFSSLLIFGSCNKEDDMLSVKEKDSKTNFQAQARTTNPMEGVTKVGSWLRFDDQDHYNKVLDNLQDLIDDRQSRGEQIVINDGSKDDYGITYDPDPELALAEISLDFYSLRKKLVIVEDDLLRDGAELEEVLLIQDLGVGSSVARSLISADGVIQIGTDIIIQVRETLRINVRDSKTTVALDIIANGPEAAFEPENSDFVTIAPNKKGKGGSRSPKCTADFMVVPNGYTNAVEKTALRTFLWNLGDAAGANDLIITWDFGDGITSVEEENSIASHTYTNLQPYPAVNNFNVCATVSYTYTDDNEVVQTCNASSCETVSIALEEVEGDQESIACKELGLAFAGSDFLDVDLLNFVETPGESETVCGTFDNAALALINQFVDGPFTVNWNFQGQSGSGIQECFYAPCDGTYQVVVQILINGEVCATLEAEHDQNVVAECEGKVDLKKSGVMFYPFEGPKATMWWAKHETNKDDSGIFWGLFNTSPNQIETKMKHYKFENNKWKKASRHNRTEIDGNIYPQGDACDCAGNPFMTNKTYQETYWHEHVFENNYKVFESQTGNKGFFCRVEDPYTVTFSPMENMNVLDQEVVVFPF